MSHFAQINDSNKVIDVVVAEQDFINTGALGDPSRWIQTSYNTQGGVHKLGGTPLRGNYAGIGYTYDRTHDVFYPPQPFPSWTISAPTWTWTAPTPMPTTGGPYTWNESTKSWVATTV